MENPFRTKNRKLATGIAALGLGVAALTAGCDNVPPDWIASSPTAEFEQYGNMFYVGGNSFTAYDGHKSPAENACNLNNTRYSTDDSRYIKGSTVVLDSTSHVMSVYPNSPTAPTLRLTGFDGDYRTPLAPADITSQNILDTNNCQHLPLEEIPAGN